MHNTAGFGRMIGWISIVLGGVALLIGLIISPDTSVAEFDRCIQQQRLGLRQAPCPPPSGIGEKWLLVGAGAGSLASGVFFLLLSGILTTLVEMKEMQERAGRTAAGPADAVRASVAQAPGRYVHPPPSGPTSPRDLKCSRDTARRWEIALGASSTSRRERASR